MKKNIVAIAASMCAASFFLPAESTAQSGGGIFQVGPVMHKARIDPFMTTLDDGRIVTFGGREFNFISCAYSDIYDPVTNTYTEVAMNAPHDMSNVVRLADGTYLLTGGSQDLGVAPGYASTELFNPATNTFTPAANMSYARCWMGACRLTNGKVLIAGAWYNTPGATYGDLYDPVTNAFSTTNAMVTPRANPLILPTDDGGAMVLGGWASYGGTNYTAVEYYSYSDNSFHAVSSEIIPSDPGWLVSGSTFQRNMTADYRMTNGKYIISAYRTSPTFEYCLLTFDPATKAFAKIALSASLKDQYTDGGFYDQVLDKAGNMVYLLGVDSASDPLKISLVAVDLATGTVYHPGSTYTLPASEYLYPNMAFLPASGKILLQGISSTSGDYYHATNKTYIITPQTGVGIKEISRNTLDINCYPNPAENILNFRSESKTNAPMDVRICDYMGSTVATYHFDHAAPLLSIDIQHIPVGIFFYEVASNGLFSRGKFIKR